MLYGRAAFDQRQRLPEIAGRLRSALGDRIVPEVLDGLSDQDVTEAVVAPCMIPTDPSLSTWLPGALSAWRAGRSDPPIVTIAPAVESFVDLSELVLRSLDEPPVIDTETVAPNMGKPGWSEIPEHGRQIFFCTGARCLHRGADPLYQRLRDAMKRERAALARGPRRGSARVVTASSRAISVR